MNISRHRNATSGIGGQRPLLTKLRFWKFKKCPFCAYPMKTYQTTITQAGTGNRLHKECLDKIQELKSKHSKHYNDAMYRSLTYIECINLGPRSRPLFVYQ